MNDFVSFSAFFGVVISLASYFFGMSLKKRVKSPLCSPLLISIILTIIFLIITKTEVSAYRESADIITWFLTPATVSLALPLYLEIEKLKKNWKAVVLGILSGVLSSLVTILLLSILFSLSHKEYVSILPKSITTAIAMGLSEEMGGFVSLTVATISITGIWGSIVAPFVFKVFHINAPIAKGVALGTSSHAIGTAKAMEMGETEGAFSSLSIVVAGIMTVILSIFFQYLH